MILKVNAGGILMDVLVFGELGKKGKGQLLNPILCKVRRRKLFYSMMNISLQ